MTASGSFEDFLDSSWQSFRQELLQAHAAATGEAKLLLPFRMDAREPHCKRSLGTELLLPIRPRSPQLDALPLPDAEEGPEMIPLDSSSSSRGKRRSRRPSVGSDDNKMLYATSAKRTSRRPSVAESELVLSLQEGMRGLEQEQELDEDDLQRFAQHVDNSVGIEAQGRLQVRLGALNPLKLISGVELHETTTALGLTSYTIEDMNQMLNTLADFIDLTFNEKESSSPRAKEKRISRGRSGAGAFFGKETRGPHNGTPQWQWPSPQPSRRISQMGRGSIQLAEPSCTWNVVPFRALVEAFSMDEQEVNKRIFTSPKLMSQFQAVKEILLAGDTNRLVAELTFVRINDLAAPPEKLDVLAYLEPVVFFTILANGVMIGIQSDPNNYGWPGWWWFELAFAIFLVVEFFLRVLVSGCYEHFRGDERWWNFFDMFFIGAAISDLMLEIVGGEDSTVAISTLLRMSRLVRVTRIMKVFRLHWMKELRLMLKGLIGGFRTLVTAMLLLFAVLYVIAGLATYLLGRDQRIRDLGLESLFYNLPISMFTTFRCLAGQCDADSGAPLPSILATEFGMPFVLGYVVSYMLVTMGISNVILAVYVDITMRAAKESEATTAEQHACESLRIARTARELLKKFASAEKIFKSSYDATESAQTLDLTPASAHFTDQVLHGRLEISKELFLLVIQDPIVQSLMDDLDLPPDRANLFEVIDADGSGTLKVSELVQGLLKVRGELKKSDVVATSLAIQSLQQLIVEMRGEVKLAQQQIMRKLGGL
eukprot:s12_g37.t1